VAKRLKETLNDVLPTELDDVLHNMQIIRNRLDGSFQQKVQKLNEITSVLVEEKEKVNKWKRVATWSLVVFGSMLLGHFVFSYITFTAIGEFVVSGYQHLDGNFSLLVLSGFIAQLVDGALEWDTASPALPCFYQPVFTRQLSAEAFIQPKCCQWGIWIQPL
jgi:hypothetical protein